MPLLFSFYVSHPFTQYERFATLKMAYVLVYEFNYLYIY
jgi:hypothetical protein